MSKSLEQFGRYSESEAQNEASKMQEKIKTGEAENYSEAEKQLEIEEKTKILESYVSPLVYKRAKEIGLGVDFGFMTNKKEFLRLWKDTIPNSFDRKELMGRIFLMFSDDFRDDLQNLDNEENKKAIAAKDTIKEILADINSIGLLKKIYDSTHGALKEKIKEQIDRVVSTPKGASEALKYVHDYAHMQDYGGFKYDHVITSSLIKSVEKVSENNIPHWFLELAEKKPRIISGYHDYKDGINRDEGDREFQKSFDSKIRELTIGKTRAVSDAELIKGGAKYKEDEKGNKILELTTEQIKEIRQKFQQHEEETKERKKSGKFKPQKAEWINDNQINILFKKGDEEAVVEIKVNKEKDGITAWYEIFYPSGGWEADVNKRPVDEIIKEIENRFGIKVTSKE